MRILIIHTIIFHTASIFYIQMFHVNLSHLTIYEQKDKEIARHDHIVSRGLAKSRLGLIGSSAGNPFQIILNFQIPGTPPVI